MLATEVSYEILTDIANFLCNNDKMTCSIVCKSWKAPFQHSLWDTLTIDSKNILQVCCISNTQPTVYQLNGNRVQSLIFQDVQTTEHELYTLQQLFPKLKTVFIPHNTIVEDKLGNLPDWNLWGGLTTMTIYTRKLNDDDQRLQVFKILACLPRLKQLTLKDSVFYSTIPQPKDTWEILEKIHESLPQLECLDTDILLGPLPVSDIPKMKNITPASTMTVVKLSDLNLDLGWIFYLGLKYPNIHSLFTEKTYSEESTVDLATDKYALKVLNLLPKFSNLKKMTVIHKGAFRLDYVLFWDTLQEPIKSLESLDYILDICSNTEIGQFDEPRTIHFSSTKIQQFSFQATDFYPNSPKIILSLGICPLLVDLKILNPGTDIELDTLLRNCISLRTVCLADTFISLSSEAFNDTITHELKSIELRRLRTASATFNYLSSCCRNLDKMSLSHVQICGKVDEDRRKLSLNMPFTRFKTLDIADTRFFAVDSEEGLKSEDLKEDDSLRFICVEQTDVIQQSMDTYSSNIRSLSTRTPAHNFKQTWYHFQHNMYTSFFCKRTQKLGEEETRIAKKFL
ncbi:hypothetical protein CLU79DRAFT_765397, partial [Phycomyces nitens]